MRERLYIGEGNEVWSLNGQIVQLALPNWGTMRCYIQVWSNVNQRWEMVLTLDSPEIIEAFRSRRADLEIATARDKDRETLLSIAEKILGSNDLTR